MASLQNIYKNRPIEQKSKLASLFMDGKLSSFAPLTLETKPVYDHYTRLISAVLPSPLYFQSLYAWNFTSVNGFRIFDDHMCLVAEDRMACETFALPPLGIPGDDRFAAAVDKVFLEMTCAKLPCSFHEVPDFMLSSFLSLENYRVDVKYEMDWSDYLFTSDEFTAATEKRSAREALRHFHRHRRPIARDISSSDRNVIRTVTERFFCAERECSACFCGCELEVVSRLIEGWDKLDMAGVVVESDGETIAFGIVCLRMDTLLFLSKKVRRRTRGINEFLNSTLMSRFGSGCKYVNYSDDMGNAGLRSYKSKIGRYTLKHRYVVQLSDKGAETDAAK